jgi:hypothetical protein
MLIKVNYAFLLVLILALVHGGQCGRKKPTDITPILKNIWENVLNEDTTDADESDLARDPLSSIQTPSDYELKTIIKEVLSAGGPREQLLGKVPELDESKYETISFSQFKKLAQPGDILLWSGDCDVCRLIRFFSFGPFSHAAMVYRDPDVDGLLVFQSTPGEDYDPILRGMNSGVQVNFMPESPTKLIWRRVIYDHPGRASWATDELRQHVNENIHREYPAMWKLPVNFILGSIGLRKIGDAPYCSEAVAEAMISQGTMNFKTVAYKFSPTGMSSERRVLDKELFKTKVEEYLVVFDE